MQNKKTLFLVEVAIFTALAYIFDLLAGVLGIKLWVQGGSISIAMVPVFLLAFRWGIKGGALSGLLLGILQIAIGQPYIVHPVQGLLDYFVAFTVLGLAGVFFKQVNDAIKDGAIAKIVTYVVAGTFLGSVLRYLAHVISGAVFFGEYAPEGTPVVLYSLIYNGTYMLPAFILSATLLAILMKAMPRYFTNGSFSIMDKKRA